MSPVVSSSLGKNAVPSRQLDPNRQAAEILTQSIEVLLKIPTADRRRFARTQLQTKWPEIVKLFAEIPLDRLARTILFISVQPHSRETRMAAAARLAGWNPILVHLGTTKYDAANFFSASVPATDLLQLVLISWLFPGPIAHVFGLNGEVVGLLCILKNCRMIIDLYDTCSGINASSKAAKAMEREAMRLADGMTHRDLRAKYLQKLYGYQLPPNNIFIHDPLVEIKTPLMRRNKSDEIRVVSIGWIGSGDNSMSRIAEALCAHGIHLHVYFSHFQQSASPDLAPYRELEARSAYFHIEKPVFGDAYWEQISQYDFGLALAERFLYNEPWDAYTHDYTRGCGSSRLTDYIQMNLGIIMSPGLRFQYFWARRFATVVVPGTLDFLHNPRPILEAALKAKTHKNRELISVRGTAQRLGNFYSQVSHKMGKPQAS